LRHTPIQNSREYPPRAPFKQELVPLSFMQYVTTERSDKAACIFSIKESRLLKRVDSQCKFFCQSNVSYYLEVKIGETSRGGGAWTWRGAHLLLSHTHTPSQIFQNTLCIVRWHKQSSQYLVCPLLICDNESVGICSGGPPSLCFLSSSWVVWGQKMCAHVTGIVWYIGKSIFPHQNISAPLNFFWGGGYVPLAPPSLPPMTYLHCFGDNRRTKDSRKIKLCGLKVCCVTLFSYCIIFSHNFPALKCINRMFEWKSLKGSLKDLGQG